MSAHVAPIRAITTPLRSSAAPPIPPPSQLYEPLAKAVLRRRLARRIFPWTLGVAMFATACLWFVVGDTRTGKGGHRAGHQGGSSMGVGARLLGAGLALWVGGVLPLVLLRKAWLTVTHTSAPSPLLLLQKSLAPPLRSRTVAALQVHVFAALWVLAVHATLLDGGVPVFIKSRKHPYTPHPALALLAFSQAVLAALYVLRAVLRDVWVFPFRPTPPHPTPASILAPLALALLAPFAALVILFVGLPLVKAVPGGTFFFGLSWGTPRRFLLPHFSSISWCCIGR
ncbi:hypothetical protein K438DRAFT_52829 [Mycena galopus ATCC 62051]|nr:hypothetical protein K438DRAFT_52829 [Mycena galopus ATCC 62051]